jgi:choline kinase
MAAGMGTRFGEMTSTKPKGFIEVAGKPMIIRSIENLLACGIKKIIIGTGYHSEYYEKLESIYPEVICHKSEVYATTNSMYTLYNCRELISNDFLLLESDLIYEKRAIEALIDSKYENIMLAAEDSEIQEFAIDVTDAGMLKELTYNNRDKMTNIYAEFVGIHKISYQSYLEVNSIFEKNLDKKPKQGYEFVLVEAYEKYPCYVLKLDGLFWYEIDNLEELKIAEDSVVDFL